MMSLKNWRIYLKEQNNRIQICCDMDGVLVDFVDGVLKKINSNLELAHDGDKYKRKLIKALDKLERKHKITLIDIGFDKSTRINAARNYMYKLVANDRDFWANLEWMPDGKILWEFIKNLNPMIITAPMSADGSKLGKHDWIKNNLGVADDKIIMTHDKYKHANPSRLLIDDLSKYVQPWQDAGGIAIQHKTAHETIEKLREILKK